MQPWSTLDSWPQTSHATEMFESSDRGVKMIGGRVYLEITDVDFVVMTKNTKHVVHTTELKTGSGDTHLKAATQLEDAKQAFARHAAAPVKHPLNLLEGGKTDVTSDIDPRSMSTATRATHGPAGKSFEPDAPSAKVTPKSPAPRLVLVSFAGCENCPKTARLSEVRSGRPATGRLAPRSEANAVC